MKRKSYWWIGRTIVVLFPLVCVTMGCTSAPKECKNVAVDLSAKMETSAVKELLDVQRLIPFRTDGQMASVDKIEVKDSLIYLLDKQLGTVCVFNAQGALKAKINKKGHARDEYVTLDDMAVDDVGTLYLYDSSSKRILFYSAEGTYLQHIDVCAGSSLALYGKETIAIHCNQLEDENIRLYSKTGKLLGKVPYTKTYPPMHLSNTALKGDGNQLYYANPFDNTVYTMGKNHEAISLVNFDFGEQNVGDDILNEQNTVAVHRKVMQAVNTVFSIRSIETTTNHLFITTDNNKNFLYNLSTGEVKVVSNLKMPFGVLFSEATHLSDDGTFFTAVSGSNMINYYSNTDKLTAEFPWLTQLKGKKDVNDNDYWLMVGKLKLE